MDSMLRSIATQQAATAARNDSSDIEDELTGQARKRGDEIDGWRNGTSLTEARNRHAGNRQENRWGRRSRCELQRIGIDRSGRRNRVRWLRILRLAGTGGTLAGLGGNFTLRLCRYRTTLHGAVPATCRNGGRFTNTRRGNRGNLRRPRQAGAGARLHRHRADRGRNREQHAEHRPIMAKPDHACILRRPQREGQPKLPPTR